MLSHKIHLNSFQKMELDELLFYKLQEIKFHIQRKRKKGTLIQCMYLQARSILSNVYTCTYL